MLHRTGPLASPDSPSATSGGQNGAGFQSPMDVLAQMVSLREPPAVPSNESSPTGSTDEPPEEPAAPVQQGEPGQDNLPPEEQPESADEPAAEGEPEAKAGDDDPDWTEAFKGLNETERKSALDLARTLQPGEIPRIAKLVAQKHQADATIETLQKQNEELQAQLDSGGGVAALPSAVPETVARLKTVEAVQEQSVKLGGEIDAITDYLDANPGDATTSYVIGERELTRQQLIDLRSEKRAMTRALNTRAGEIKAQTQFAAAQQQNRAAFAEAFPWMKDTDHAETRAVTEFVARNPWVKSFPDPELTAAKLLRGEKSLKQEFESRKGVKPGAVTKPVGKVPPGKPHAPANGGVPRVNPDASIQSALENHSRLGSRNSFAAVLASTGR